MGVSTPGGGHGGRRKSLDAEINLVPFIDLLSMCICFLLITAVWIEVGAVQVKQSHGTDGVQAAPTDLEMELKFNKPQSITVSVKKKGKPFQKWSIEAPSDSKRFLAQLDEKVRQASGMGKVSSAMLTPAKGVDYGEMVSVMDLLRKNQISNLGVHPVRDAL